LDFFGYEVVSAAEEKCGSRPSLIRETILVVDQINSAKPAQLLRKRRVFGAKISLLTSVLLSMPILMAILEAATNSDADGCEVRAIWIIQFKDALMHRSSRERN
jgi:hypothetical protein